MTIEDAIFVLNCVEAHNGICNEAKEMAIKSLEAWGKVKEQLNKDYIGEVLYDGGIEHAIDVIDKHLLEVEHGNDNN